MGGCQQCAPEAASCNEHFPCCRGMRCEAVLGGRGRRCVKFHPMQRCSALWKRCSVFGIFAPKCCNRFQCIRHGILDWKCEPNVWMWATLVEAQASGRCL